MNLKYKSVNHIDVYMANNLRNRLWRKIVLKVGEDVYEKVSREVPFKIHREIYDHLLMHIKDYLR